MRTRRHILGLLGGCLLSVGTARRTWGQAAARLVVVGGGFAGATCAKYLRLADSTLQVTLLAPQPTFISCPFSNTVLAGLNDLTMLTQHYTALRQRHGIHVLHKAAADVEPVRRQVLLADGQRLAYDRLVLAPGVEMHWDALPGYDAAASTLWPHAWQAGPQTLLLRRQLEAMPDGGLVVITVPDNPYRCPPGPYERASLIAHYLKTHKPRSKVLLLDTKDSFTKQALFQEAWQRLYGSLLEWVPGSQGGRVARVAPQRQTIETDFDTYRPSVANIIPPQRAAAIARVAGLDAGTGWCAVTPQTFESTVHAGIHLLGDAIIANPMPKSAFSANNQAKVCAAALLALLRGHPLPEPFLLNTCYSLVAPDYGIHIAGAYHVVDQRLTAMAGSEGTSPLGAPDEIRGLEAEYARSWYANILADVFS
ncbi:MAG: FCSD flavin-binding domain-containing protein [Candidatus Tectimicrobiota bacterium]